MKKFKGIIIGIVVVLVIILGMLFMIGYFKPKPAGLSIKTDSLALVFIDGEEVGKTPFKLTRKEGEVIVMLIPEGNEIPLTPYETRVNLVSGIETIINREFGETDELSSGTIISFEKLKGKETSMAIISIPDASQVSIDNFVRGFTPFKTNSVLPADHEIKVSAPGYVERSDYIKTVEGYKLTAIVKLAIDDSLKEKIEEEEKKKENIVKVEILSTPTDFLRVRSDPSINGKEVTQVKPGEKYLLLDEDENSEWFKIQSSPSGWVSSKYSQKI